MQKNLILIYDELHAKEQLTEHLLAANPDIAIHKLTLNTAKTELPIITAKLNRPVIMAIGEAASFAWKIAGESDQAGGILLVHPAELADFQNHKLNQTCLIIHHSSTSLTSIEVLKTLQRPRPDIAQLVNDDPEQLLNLMATFIQQFAGSKPGDLGQIIRAGEINNRFPAPAPGAIPVFEDENCYIGAVRPDMHTPYEHINYRDEIHVILSGSGYFRHGNGEATQVKQGDIAYVKAFEKHRWSDWSEDFKLLFIQCGRNPLLIEDKK